MPRLKIRILFEHSADLIPHGSAYIREILPLTHPANAGEFIVNLGTDYGPADVVIVQRMWKPGFCLDLVEQLVDRARKDGACLIYSIDDNLLDLPDIPIEALRAIRYLCRESDGILVSTHFLKERLQYINTNICVIPNALDERLFTNDGGNISQRTTVGERKVFGYMGTYTHDADLMMVLQPLRSVMRIFSGSVEFQLVGGLADSAFLKSLEGFTVRVLRVPVEEVEYPRFVSWMKSNLGWHFGIAPLEDTYFNRSKSDIKYLDYSALGIPGIYSAVPAYQATIQHMDTGYLVDNTPTAWAEALERMLGEDDLRERLASQAQEHVFSTRTLEHCGRAWNDAIRSIVKRQ